VPLVPPVPPVAASWLLLLPLYQLGGTAVAAAAALPAVALLVG